MHLSRLLTIACTSLALGVAAAAPARPAEACGGYRPAKTTAQLAAEEAAQAAVEAHFAALARGDAKAVRKVWSPAATIKAMNPDGKATRTEKLGKALPRWLRARDGLQWTILGVFQGKDGDVTVTAHVIWDGVRYDDVLTLAEQDGRWRITAKASYRNHDEVTAATTGGY